ncbi:MAG: nucleoside transporter C-terminal domain-containing protein, partial [Bacteroidota bacterium]
GGASDGLQLSLNVGAMLLAFIALIAMFNYILLQIGDMTGLNAVLMAKFNQPMNMQLLLGLVLQFVAFAVGVPWQDSLTFGSLIGTKVVLNEFVAYLDLAKVITARQNGEKASPLATFALCGFANFSSIAIQIGGISPMAPHRRKDIASLGLKAVLGGTLATLMTATIAGVLLGS